MNRTLRKSGKSKILLGVAGGLGEYFRIDPLVFRVAFILLAFANGLGILIYLLLALFMPRAAAPSTDPVAVLRNNVATAPGEATEAGRRVIRMLRGQPPAGEPTQPATTEPPASEESPADTSTRH